MAKVIRRDGESVESLIKRFTAQCGKEGIMKDYRKHMEYTKPSDLRKAKEKERQINIAKYKAYKKRQDARLERFEKQLARKDKRVIVVEKEVVKVEEKPTSK